MVSRSRSRSRDRARRVVSRSRERGRGQARLDSRSRSPAHKDEKQRGTDSKHAKDSRDGNDVKDIRNVNNSRAGKDETDSRDTAAARKEGGGTGSGGAAQESTAVVTKHDNSVQHMAPVGGAVSQESGKGAARDGDGGSTAAPKGGRRSVLERLGPGPGMERKMDAVDVVAVDVKAAPVGAAELTRHESGESDVDRNVDVSDRRDTGKRLTQVASLVGWLLLMWVSLVCGSVLHVCGGKLRLDPTVVLCRLRLRAGTIRFLCRCRFSSVSLARASGKL